MPVHNAERYLRDAIDSVLGQTLGDFEFIVVNDGSTDDTAAILDEYSRRDTRFRIHTGPNQGVAAALNTGLAMARGEFIARMDGDDRCHPQRFEKQAQYLREHPNCVLVGSRCMLIDPGGFPICEKHDIVFGHDEIESALLRVSWAIVHPAVMMRADALRKIGGYDPALRANEDHDLFLRMAEVGKLENLPEVLFQYRQHLRSAGAKKSMAQQMEIYHTVQRAHARRGLAYELPSPENMKVLDPSEHRTNWFWWALSAGNVSTARRLAWEMVRQSPCSRASWRAAFCAIRGR